MHTKPNKSRFPMLYAFIMKTLAEFFTIKMLAVHMTKLNYLGKWLISDHVETLESMALLQNQKEKIDAFSYRKIAIRNTKQQKKKQ